MPSVLTVTLTHVDDGLAVQCLSMAGEPQCEAFLALDSTLEDVVDDLKPKLGFPKAYFDMYVRGEIVVDREQLAITRSQDQITMSADSFGPCRKFLAAMSKRAFHRDSKHLDVSWRLQKARDVDHKEVAPFLEEKGVSRREEAVRLMRVVGRLASDAETWNMLNLALLMNFDAEMNNLKHAVGEHWLHVGQQAAKQKVPADPLPLCLFRRDERGMIIGMIIVSVDGAYPESFDDLQNSVRISDICPGHSLGEMLWAVASLEFDDTQTSSEVIQAAAARRNADVTLHPHPSPEDVVRMAHVQLLLSCNFGLVEVERNLPPNLVQSVADLLRWHLRVLRFGQVVTNIDPSAQEPWSDFAAAFRQHLHSSMQEASETQKHFRGAPGLCSHVLGSKEEGFSNFLSRFILHALERVLCKSASHNAVPKPSKGVILEA